MSKGTDVDRVLAAEFAVDDVLDLVVDAFDPDETLQLFIDRCEQDTCGKRATRQHEGGEYPMCPECAAAWFEDDGEEAEKTASQIPTEPLHDNPALQRLLELVVERMSERERCGVAAASVPLETP